VHLYLTGAFQTFAGMQASRWDEIGIMVSENARDYLYDGYTTVRDTGGMSDGLRRLMEKGETEGPRVYSCGAVIGPTSGHGDWRIPPQVFPGADPDVGEKMGFTYLADGADEIRKASRHCFANGARFLKLMAGGGVSSELDPLWSIAYSVDELKSAVEAASFFDTYVTVHAYTDETVSMALDAGVKCIEHGQMVSEETVKRIADEGIFWALNVAGMDPALLQHPNYAMPTVKPKLEFYLEESRSLAEYVKKHRPKIVHNVDTVLSTIGFGRQHRDFEKYYFAQMFGNFEALRSMTSTAGELAQLTNKRNPYPDGKLGVIEKGAYADILIVDGNPLEDLSCLGANPKWFDAPPRDRGFDTIKLIMKDGKIYKNTL
jgi:imidazolonepropionase-like amidohydrolase